MSEAKPLLFSGTTLQRAVLAAANHFGLEAEEVDYRIRDRAGAIRGAGKILIEVDPARPRREQAAAMPRPPEPPAPAPAVARPPAVPSWRDVPRPAAAEALVIARPEPGAPATARLVATGPEAEAVAEAVGRLLALADLHVEGRLYHGEGALELELQGPDQALLLGGDGELLTALGHLVPRVARGLVGEAVAVRLDSAGFREAHETRLRELAHERAEQVRRSGRPVVLEEMSPSDRRIVHLALADEGDVETESRGEGFFKRVSILPKNHPPR